MRYELVDNIVFTDKDGKSVTIKDMREFPTDYLLKMIMAVSENDMIDEICCRKDVYDQDSEFMAYKIYDFNIMNLFENNFNLGSVKELRLPL